MSAARELHPVLTPARREELVREGTELFHAGRYFTAHEAWEEIWRSTTPEPRDLFQGLVQLAAAFHHLHERRRPDVARRVLAKARRRLGGLREGAAETEPLSAGTAPARDRGSLDGPALLAQIERWEAWLAEPAGEPPLAVRLSWRRQR